MFGFRGKFDLNIPEDVERLAVLKQEIRLNNATQNLKAKLAMRGRLGRDNPNAVKYREKQKRIPWKNAYQHIYKADAAYFMVWVYTR